MSRADDLLDASLRDRVSTHLAHFERLPPEGGELTPAAVALVLTADERGRASFLITRRASHLPDHPGQWALPGGRVDAGEGPVDTALRELSEEIGLELPSENALGLLDDYPTRSGFVITPVVVWGGPGCEAVPNPDEVAAVYAVPLALLDRPEVPHLRRIPESDQPVISIPMLDTHIHAPTAAILFQLREVAMAGRSTRVSHFEQPVFAWK